MKNNGTPVIEVDLEIPPMPPEPLGSPVVWLRKFYKAIDEAGGEQNVPCGTCDACCRDFEEIFLTEEEAHKYDHTIHEDGRKLLARKDGHCAYLTDMGCTTYGDRPDNCRQFDCRALAHCGLFPVDFPRVNAAIEHWDVEVKTEEEKVLGMALRLAARSAVEKDGKDPFAAAGQAVFGGYATFAREAVALVRKHTAETEGPKIIDQFGQKFD